MNIQRTEEEHLGYAFEDFRSQTNRLASAFHAFMHPSEVPMNSFSQTDNKIKISLYYLVSSTVFHKIRPKELQFKYKNTQKHTKLLDLQSHSRDMISVPQLMVAFLDVGAGESKVHILHHSNMRKDSTTSMSIESRHKLNLKILFEQDKITMAITNGVVITLGKF